MNPTIKRHKEKVIGYKALKKDKNGYYTDGMNNVEKFYFEVDKTYEVKGELKLRKNGLHFFRHYCFAIDYLEKDNVICKVESLGDVIEDTEKCVTNKLKILEIEYSEEVDDHRNSGHYNSGNRNSGDYNSGDYNSGDCNSGNYNSGNRNSGNRNSGNRNSGDCNSGNRNSGDCNSGYCNSGDCNSGSGYRNFFCTDTRYFLFDIECSKKEAKKCYSLDMTWFDLSKGYKKAWSKCPKKVLDEIKKLKNFNADKFYEITGIEVK